MTDGSGIQVGEACGKVLENLVVRRNFHNGRAVIRLALQDAAHGATVKVTIVHAANGDTVASLLEMDDLRDTALRPPSVGPEIH